MPMASRSFLPPAYSMQIDLGNHLRFKSNLRNNVWVLSGTNDSYAASDHPVIDIPSLTYFTLGSLSFGADYEIALATIIQAFIDESDYQYGDPFMLMLGLANVANVGADNQGSIFTWDNSGRQCACNIHRLDRSGHRCADAVVTCGRYRHQGHDSDVDLDACR